MQTGATPTARPVSTIATDPQAHRGLLEIANPSPSARAVPSITARKWNPALKPSTTSEIAGFPVLTETETAFHVRLCVAVSPKSPSRRTGCRMTIDPELGMQILRYYHGFCPFGLVQRRHHLVQRAERGCRGQAPIYATCGSRRSSSRWRRNVWV